MSWARSLCDLYDRNVYLAGESLENQPMLLPICHTTAKAQAEILINMDGELIRASKVEKDQATTLCPATERSAARSNGIEPMPLFDKLIYLAKDYSLYIDGKDNSNEFHNQYLAALKKWVDSPYHHPKVNAVYQYLLQGRVVQDLIRADVLKPDEYGKITHKEKVNGIDQTDIFIRFKVHPPERFSMSEKQDDTDHVYQDEMWLDKSVQRSFIEYYTDILSQQSKDLCYLTGEKMFPATRHPAKIRNEADSKAKLFSSNDNENFTYKGRFNVKDKDGYSEAMSIGYITSQKIHNALKWIIRRQGKTRDGLCFVTWEEDLKNLPGYSDSSSQIISSITDEDFEDEDDEQFQISDTGFYSAERFKKALNGYGFEEKENDSQVVILALNDATPGRLALTYYKELKGSQYLEKIEEWHDSCRWWHFYIDKEKKYRGYEGMVSFGEIAAAVYGVEQNEKLVLRKNSDGKAIQLIKTFERLTRCVLEGKNVPQDLVNYAVIRASQPLAYKNKLNYQRVLNVACSLVKRSYWERQKENPSKGVKIGMALDVTNSDRSYLYGRLLALAEAVENSAMNESGDSRRSTNSEKLRKRFSEFPHSTWGILYKKLDPYFKRLSIGLREYYQSEIDEIMALFKPGDFECNQKLSGLYLMGYSLQRKHGKDKKEKSKLKNQTVSQNIE